MGFLQYTYRVKTQNKQKDFYCSSQIVCQNLKKAKQKDSSCAVAVLL
ncbi:hypothetical protein HMPREF9398_1492 [Streptococcus sanguinis VMC66]|nr:hypothetical protein HMPREF9398_1492 [Streptococcus sanguinis VMC66]